MINQFNEKKLSKLFFFAATIGLIAVIALIFLVIGPGKNITGNSLKTDRQKETYIPPLPSRPSVELPKIIYNFSGTITKLEKDAIDFNAEVISINEGEIVKTIQPKKAVVSVSTRFSRLTFINNSSLETKIKLEDLKIGDYIEAVSDQDISKAQEFFAIQIRILP